MGRRGLGGRRSGASPTRRALAGRSVERHPAIKYRRPNAPVAQLDRALPSEGRGREFESRRVRHTLEVLGFDGFLEATRLTSQ